MAINPELSLGVRPPVIQPLQIQNPLEQYGKVLTLRNLMQEQQSGQLGLQAQQLKLREAQKGIEEDDAVRQLYAKNPNPTRADLISTLGPTRAAALIKSQSDQLQQFYKTEGERYNLLGRLAGSATDKTSAIDAVMRATASNAFDTDPQKNAEAGRKLLEHLNTNGFNPTEFKQFQSQAMDAAQQHTAQLADLEESRKATLAPIELATKKAEGEQKQRQIEASTLAPALARGAVAFQQALAKMPPERAALYQGFTSPRDVLMFASTPTEQITAQQAADTAAEAAKQHAIQNANEQTRIGISRQEQALRQQEQALRQRQFDATYGALVDPTTGKTMDAETAKATASQDPVAVGIANYQAAPPSMSRGGAAAAIMRKVLAINPDYNAQNWQAQGTMLKNATRGKMGNELRASNTALGHVGLLYDAIDSLNNGDLRALNAIGNRLGLETGSTPAAVFKTIVGKVGPELAQAYGEATGGERGAEKGNFDPALPPQTLRANAAITAKLLAGKLAATKFQFQSTPGFEKRNLPMISPEAQGVLDRLEAGTGAKPAGGSGATTINTKAEYDKLPSGSKYVDSQDGKTYTKR